VLHSYAPNCVLSEDRYPSAHLYAAIPAPSPIVRGEGKAKMRDRPADAGANTKRNTEVGKHSYGENSTPEYSPPEDPGENVGGANIG